MYLSNFQVNWKKNSDRTKFGCLHKQSVIENHFYRTISAFLHAGAYKKAWQAPISIINSSHMIILRDVDFECIWLAAAKRRFKLIVLQSLIISTHATSRRFCCCYVYNNHPTNGLISMHFRAASQLTRDVQLNKIPSTPFCKLC